MHRREVKLEAVQRRTGRMNPKPAVVDPAIESEANRPHVADVLGRRLLELKTDDALAATTGGIDEAGGDRRLGGSGTARQHDGAAAEISLVAEHLVEPIDSGRDALG